MRIKTFFMIMLFMGSIPVLSHAQMTIVTDTIVPTSTCPGGFLFIPFTVTNPNTNPGNRYYAEWSTLFGGFSNPDTVGSIPFVFGGSGFIPGQIPLNAGLGIYQVRVVSSNPGVIGSAAPLPIIITALPASANITANPALDQCEGVPVTLRAGQGMAASYSWNTGDTTNSIVVTNPGNYSVTVTRLGCENISDPFSLNMLSSPAQPTISVATNGTFLSSPENAYQWYFQGNPIPAATSSSHLPTQSGSYSVVVIASNGCPSPASNPLFHIVNDGTLIGSPEPVLAHSSTGLDLWVYPNPAQTQLNIRIKSTHPKKVSYRIFNAQGKAMLHSASFRVRGTMHQKIDLSSLSAGYYSLQLHSNGQYQSINFLKMGD